MSDADFISLCKEGSPSEVQAAIKARADVNARDEAGWTPLQRAAFKNPNPELITTLLKAGADPKAKNDSGKLPIELANRNVYLQGTDAYKALECASK